MKGKAWYVNFRWNKNDNKHLENFSHYFGTGN